jgi:lipoate-protein ligase B
VNRLHVCELGPVRYRDGLRLMDALVAARAAGQTGDWLLYPEHEPVLTVGRGASPGSVRADAASLARAGIELVEVPRGGDVTWHGPGQLVGYPVVALDRVGRDLHRWLRTLEDALIGALGRFGLDARRVPGRTGVWLSEREKIASIGVAVRRWVGYHGFALNVEDRLEDFGLIHPCGYRDIRMTSVARALGRAAPGPNFDGLPARVRDAVTAELVERLGFENAVRMQPAAAWALAGIAEGADTSKLGAVGGPAHRDDAGARAIGGA